MHQPAAPERGPDHEADDAPRVPVVDERDGPRAHQPAVACSGARPSTSPPPRRPRTPARRVRVPWRTRRACTARAPRWARGCPGTPCTSTRRRPASSRRRPRRSRRTARRRGAPRRSWRDSRVTARRSANAPSMVAAEAVRRARRRPRARTRWLNAATPGLGGQPGGGARRDAPGAQGLGRRRRPWSRASAARAPGAPGLAAITAARRRAKSRRSSSRAPDAARTPGRRPRSARSPAGADAMASTR